MHDEARGDQVDILRHEVVVAVVCVPQAAGAGQPDPGEPVGVSQSLGSIGGIDEVGTVCRVCGAMLRLCEGNEKVDAARFCS
jgi:hypothetical protein